MILILDDGKFAFNKKLININTIFILVKIKKYRKRDIKINISFFIQMNYKIIVNKTKLCYNITNLF